MELTIEFGQKPENNWKRITLQSFKIRVQPGGHLDYSFLRP